MALDHLSREQLVSLLYEILRRLLGAAQPTCPEEEPSHSSSSQEAWLVVDPTIDASNHTGFYPQGYNPPQDKGSWSPCRHSLVPQFGNSSMGACALPASTASVALFAGPPWTAFSRPWQPGYPAPRQMPVCSATEVARPPDDPWAAPEGAQSLSIENPTRNPALPLDTLLNWQNRANCPCLCKCSCPCVVTRVGHVLHFCRGCIDQRPVGEPRSGA